MSFSIFLKHFREICDAELVKNGPFFSLVFRRLSNPLLARSYLSPSIVTKDDAFRV